MGKYTYSSQLYQTVKKIKNKFEITVESSLMEDVAFELVMLA